MSAAPDPQQLFDTIQVLIAGHQAADVANVLLNCLVVCVVQSLPTVEEAEEAVEQMLDSVKADIRDSWSEVRNEAVRCAADAGSA